MGMGIKRKVMGMMRGGGNSGIGYLKAEIGV